MDNFVNSQDIEGNTAILLSIKNVFKYSNELFEYLEQNIDNQFEILYQKWTNYNSL